MPKLIFHEPEREIREFDLQPGVYRLGREENNEIVLVDQKASRRHACIRYDPSTSTVTLEDLKSSNGTYLNGSKLEGKKDLQSEDEIVIGLTRIRLVAPELEEDDTEEMVVPADDRTQMIDPDQLAAIVGTAPVEEEGGDTEEMVAPADISSETVVLEAGRSVKARYPKLVVVSEPHRGTEYVLDQVENHIGRAADCAIRLADAGTSSHHAVIRVDGDRSVLEDLGSKNGTRARGKRITKEVSLQTGEEIEIGDTVMKYIGSDTILTADEIQSKPKSKRRRSLMLAMAAVALGLFFWGVLQNRKSVEDAVPDRMTPAAPTADNAPESAQTPSPQAAKDPEPSIEETVEKKVEITAQEAANRKTAEIFFTTAEDFLKVRLWAEALNKYQQVHQLQPDFPGLQQRISEAEFEQENEGLFEEGHTLAANQDLEPALAAFEGIPEQSVYYDEALTEAQAVRSRIEALSTQAQQPDGDAVLPVPPAEPSAAPQPASAEEVTASMDKAVHLYTQGKIEQALKQIEQTLTLDLAADDPLRSDAETLKARIARVRNLYGQGIKEYDSGRPSQAFQTWAQVLTLDQQIAGTQASHMADQIADHMASEFYLRAQSAFDAGEFAQARENAAKALKAAPGHAGSLEVNHRLSEKARRIYEEGYILEDLSPDEAVEKWRQVLRICPADNEYYQKAQAKIEKYAR